MILADTLDWNKTGGLIPAIIQDASSLSVLMLGYMNREALEQTQNTGLVTFYSRTKQRLWQKGETSGNMLRVRSITKDCDADTLLILVDSTGPTCHTGSKSCFGKTAEVNILSILEATVRQRQAEDSDQSYTASLFRKSLSRIAQKVGEEGVEVALAGASRADNLCDEAADLLYHLIVLLVANNKSFNDVLSVLQARASSVRE